MRSIKKYQLIHINTLRKRKKMGVKKKNVQIQQMVLQRAQNKKQKPNPRLQKPLQADELYSKHNIFC